MRLPKHVIAVVATVGTLCVVASTAAITVNGGAAGVVPEAAGQKVAAACATCRWYAEYDTYRQAQAAANAHLRANPGHNAGVLVR